MSTASLVGSTLSVTADPGFFAISPGHPGTEVIRQTTFQADPIQLGKLDVYDGGTLLGRFAMSSIKNVDMNVAYLDNVNVDDSNGLPFAAGTTISLSSYSGGFGNSLNLTGSRTISGGETYAAGNGAQGGSLTLGGSTYKFNSAIGSVSDSVKTTGPLVVKAFGSNVWLSGSNGVTQTLSGLSNGGAGDTLTYSNKNPVYLEMFGANATAHLNATAAAAGEQSFVTDLLGNDEGVQINATPSTVGNGVVAAGQGDAVTVAANSSSVSIQGNSSTYVSLGTSGIKRDVFVTGVGELVLNDSGNNTTPENVKVTQSIISGTGLFGNNAAVVEYHNTGHVQISTGEQADTYTIAGSKPGAHFGSSIEIDDNSTVGLNVAVALDAGSGLDLHLNNGLLANPAPASLLISAPQGTYSPPAPPLPTGGETMTFAGGLTSYVIYQGFTSVDLANPNGTAPNQ
jgi:hypothetical protein